MKELITRPQANGFFIAILMIGMVTVFVMLSKTKSRPKALLYGGPLVLVGILWWIYNAITDLIGINTVLNLGVNAILFLIVGLGCGIWYRKNYQSLQSTLSQDIMQDLENSEEDQDKGGILVGVLPTNPKGTSGEGRTFEEALEPPRDFG